MGVQASERHGWRRYRLALVVGVLVLLGVIAKQAVTRFVNMGLYAKRAEGIWRLEQIRKAQLEYFKTHGQYVAAGPTPQRVPGTAQVRFESEHMAGWQRLGWQPDSMVRCQFEVTVPTPTDFRAVARCDADGDGQESVFVSTSKQAPKRTSPDDHY